MQVPEVDYTRMKDKFIILNSNKNESWNESKNYMKKEKSRKQFTKFRNVIEMEIGYFEKENSRENVDLIWWKKLKKN